MTFMFVVDVTQATGHGEASNPILVTEDVKKAVYAARKAEMYGYEFDGTDIGTTVYRLAIDVPYIKSDFKWNVGDNPPRTMVFGRSHNRWHNGKSHPANGTCWKEEWFDKKLQQVVDGVSA